MGYKITRNHRENLIAQKGKVIWLTGLSGSGKTTIAQALEARLHNDLGYLTYVLDGDVLRSGLNIDLNLSLKGRCENIRRAAHVAALFADAGIVVICAFISPHSSARKSARELMKVPFFEVFIKCPIEECRRRDPKGLYAMHADDYFTGLTGIDDPYEEPTNPELVVETDIKSVDECVNDIINLIK
jgi:adenylylsulfate kinase